MMSKRRNRFATRSVTRNFAFVLLSFLPLAGCTHAPAFEILGSYFPAWMFCILTAIVLTVALRLLVRHFGLEERLTPLMVTYPCLAAFLSFTLWLLFFN